MAIQFFRCKDTARLFAGERVRRFIQMETVAMRKLAILHRAAVLDDLRIPPGNRLEALRGVHSIRINDQWRICFVWTRYGPEQVEIVDYH